MEYKKDYEDLISVVVPVYNVEKYLRRCVDSIISQTYNNLEIILIDDGSPDLCGEICDTYALADSRIKVIHKQNGGLSDARNCGIEISSGKYIAFVDSDDFIAAEYIEYLYGLLKKNKADISCCSMVKTDNNNAQFDFDNTKFKEQVKTGIECCYELFGDLYMLLVTAWGKLYKKDLIIKHLFPIGKKHEDEATTCKYYYNARKVAISDARLYAYFQNASGITHSLGNGINYDAVWALEHRALFFEENDEQAIAQLAWNCYFHYCVTDTLKNNGRCDDYLIDFERGKSLNKRTIFESRLFSTSRFLFRLYWNIKEVLKKVKNKLHQKR